MNKGDRAAISVLLNYLRNSPQDLVNIAVRFTSPTVSYFLLLLVHLYVAVLYL